MVTLNSIAGCMTSLHIGMVTRRRGVVFLRDLEATSRSRRVLDDSSSLHCSVYTGWDCVRVIKLENNQFLPCLRLCVCHRLSAGRCDYFVSFITPMYDWAGNPEGIFAYPSTAVYGCHVAVYGRPQQSMVVHSSLRQGDKPQRDFRLSTAGR